MVRWKLTAGRPAHAAGYIYYPGVTNDAACAAAEHGPVHEESEEDGTDRGDTRSTARDLEWPLIEAPTNIRVDVLTDVGPARFRWREPHPHVGLLVHEDGSTPRRACNITLGTSNVCCLDQTVRL